MKKKIKIFLKNRPVTAFWFLSVLIAIVLAPVGLVIFQAYPDFGKESKQLSS